MKMPEYFHKTPDYGCYRPVGQFSPQEVTALIGAVITYCCERRCRR
jgi:hypothetical protein